MCVAVNRLHVTSGEVAPQPSYMQLAAPPVHPGAPVVDRGFTGPGGASGGARRRLASKLFERQHSLQDPSFDPVSQRFGRDEVRLCSDSSASLYGRHLSYPATVRSHAMCSMQTELLLRVTCSVCMVHITCQKRCCHECHVIDGCLSYTY